MYLLVYLGWLFPSVLTLAEFVGFIIIIVSRTKVTIIFCCIK